MKMNKEIEVVRDPMVTVDPLGFNGWLDVKLFGPDGEMKMFQQVPNRITDIGDQYYGERATGIASPPAQVTGMRLGTGTTAASKTGAGAAIVTYITASHVAISSGPTSSQPGGATTARRIAWVSTWAAGVATATGIAEVVITNETPLTNVAGTAANTIARAVLTAFDKGAGDTLTVTWNHDLLGA